MRQRPRRRSHLATAKFRDYAETASDWFWPSLTIRSVYQVGDAGDTGVEHLVGHREGVGEGGLLVRHPEQVLVGDDDQRVDALLQLHDPRFGETHASLAFEVEGLGDDADREDAKLAGGARHHRGGAGSGAASHASGDV